MSGRRAGSPNRCPNCRINSNLCVCKWIKPLEVQTNVSLVVHIRELKLTSNTAQFVEKMIPNQSRIWIRGRVNESFDASPILERTGQALFLYPHEDAHELNAEFLQQHPGPYHLIVPDGNWHQARRVRRREEGFKNLKAVTLPPGPLSEYRLRRAPQPSWLSTYEAVAHALGIMEGVEVRDQLMTFFRHWVQRTLHNREGRNC
jgi:DTW domain-containing protein